MSKTTRRGFLGIVAAIAAAVPLAGKAEAVEICDGCEFLRANPVPLPDACRRWVTPEATERAIQGAHETAGDTSVMAHRNAAALIYARAFEVFDGNIRPRGILALDGSDNIKIGGDLVVTGNTTMPSIGTLRLSNHAPLRVVKPGEMAMAHDVNSFKTWLDGTD